MELQAAEQLLAPAPSLATAVAPLAAIAPLAAGAPLAAVAPEVALAVAAAAPTVAEAFAAPASKTPELPKLNGEHPDSIKTPVQLQNCSYMDCSGDLCPSDDLRLSYEPSLERKVNISAQC